LSTARPTTRKSSRRSAAEAGAASPKPFFWAGGTTGCLLVHGLTGSPYEMRFLGEQLRTAGHTVSGILVGGHGTRPEDLERCRWQDWYQSVEAGFEVLTDPCSNLVAVGLSMGALLALRLACDHPDEVAAVVVLSPALILRNPWPARLENVLAPLSLLLPSGMAHWPKGDSDIADPEARKRHPGYKSLPLQAVVELVRLQREVRSLLSKVHQPVLAIQGCQDHTVALENLAVLRRELPNLRGTVILPASCHVVTVDLEKERVAEEIIRFVDQVVDRRSTGAREGRL
jgi:carboxylesterase